MKILVAFLFGLFRVVCLVLKLVPEKNQSCSAHLHISFSFQSFIFL